MNPRSRATFAAILSLALGACGLPGRDNAYDPSSAPSARLQIRDGGGPASCLPIDVAAAQIPIATVARAHCLLLDASASASEAGLAGPLHFRFAVLDSSGHATTLPVATDSSARLMVLSDAVRALAVGEHTFEVWVTQGSRIGVARTNVSLVALPPVAVVDPPRSFPVGGYAWSQGTPFTITFDGSRSFDPDLDPITEYCWTLPDGTQPPCSTSPTATFSAPSIAAGAFAASLVVKDAFGPSLPVEARYEIGAPPLWAYGFGTTGFANGAKRIDQNWREHFLGGSGELAWALELIEPTASPVDARVVVMDQSALSIDLFTEQDFQKLSSIDAMASAEEPQAMYVDPSTSRIWTISQDGSDTRELQAFRIVSDTLVLDVPPMAVPSNHLEESFPQPAAPPMQLATDISGNVYYGAWGGMVAHAVSPAGTPLAAWSLDGGDGLFGLARRDATGEVWAVEGESLVSATIGNAAILRFSPTAAPTRYPVPNVHTAFGMAWIDGDRFWTVLGPNLCLIDGARLASSGDVAQSIDVLVPASASSAMPAVDRASGTAWWQTQGLDKLIEVRPDGTSHTFATSFFPQRIDESGNLWSILADHTNSGEGPVVKSDGLFPDATTTSVELDGIPAPDQEGGLWISVNSTRQIDHIGSDGTLLRRITSLRSPTGQVFAIPAFIALSLAPPNPADQTNPGGSLWGGSFAATTAGVPAVSVVRIDLAGGNGADEAGLASMTPAAIGFPAPVVALKSGATSRAWVKLSGIFGGHTFAVFDDAGEHDIFSATGGEANNPAFFAASDATGSGCVLTADGTGNIFLRKVKTSGTLPVTLLATIPVISGSKPLAVDAAPAGGVDACWIAWHEAPAAPGAPTIHVTAYGPTGTVLRNTFDAGTDPSSLFVTDPNDAWLLRSGPTSGQSSLELFPFAANGTPLGTVPYPDLPVTTFLGR